MYTSTFIIGSEDRKRIKCSLIVHEKNVSFFPKKIFVCDCYVDFTLNWHLQKTNWKDIYHKVTDVMNETTFMLVSKKLSLVVKKVFIVIYAQMVGKKNSMVMRTKTVQRSILKFAIFSVLFV